MKPFTCSRRADWISSCTSESVYARPRAKSCNHGMSDVLRPFSFVRKCRREAEHVGRHPCAERAEMLGGVLQEQRNRPVGRLRMGSGITDLRQIAVARE